MDVCLFGVFYFYLNEKCLGHVLWICLVGRLLGRWEKDEPEKGWK